jgi:hypothetical protein
LAFTALVAENGVGLRFLMAKMSMEEIDAKRKPLRGFFEGNQNLRKPAIDFCP